MPSRGGTRRIGAAAARQGHSRILDEVREDERPVIIEKSGVPVAAVVPLSMLDREQRWALERADRVALLERLRRPFRDVSAAELERETIAAVRDIRRRRRRTRTPRR